MEEAQEKENETCKKNVSCSSYCNTKKNKFSYLVQFFIFYFFMPNWFLIYLDFFVILSSILNFILRF
jgi:hypothetical protein